MIVSDGVVVWLAVAGGCALILGAHRAGIALASPAFLRFVLWPNFVPSLDQIPVTPLLLLLPVILVFVGISVLQSAVHLFYGQVAGGYVAGHYLVRVFDSIGRGMIALLKLPFRLLGRRHRL
jgi:uncharacterized membrane protein